jgi:hypothetical protein
MSLPIFDGNENIFLLDVFEFSEMPEALMTI